MSDESSRDLDLAPVRSGPSKGAIIAVIAGVLGVGGAVYLNNKNAAERKAMQLQKAADAWADLSSCLMGPEAQIGQIARRARRMELAVPSSVARLPAAERRRQWPYRCATYASVMTRALFDSKSDERAHRILAMVVSQAATDLESGQLHTAKDDRRKYLDELWAAVAQASLPPGRSTARIPPPPTPVEPMSAPLLDAILAGPDNAKVIAQDPLAQNTLRVLFGLSERRLCTFANDGGPAGLSRFDCVRVRPSDYERRHPWLGGADDGQPALFAGRTSGNDAITRAFLSPSLALGEAVEGGYTTEQYSALLRFDAERPELRVTVLRRGRESQPAGHSTELVATHTISSHRPGGWIFGDVVVALGERPSSASTSGADAGAPSGDASVSVPDAAARDGATEGGGPSGPREGVLYAGALSIDPATLRVTWSQPFAERGSARASWPSEPRVEACRTATGATAIAAFSSDGHALVLWRTASGFLSAIRAEAKPGVIHCEGDYLRIGWFEAIPIPSAHVTTCGQTGCAHARAPAPDIDTDPVIAPVGHRVLAVYTQRVGNGGYGGLRYRIAPLMDLASAPERVIFDDAEHEGLAVEPTIPVFVRGARAVVLVTSKGVAGETYAFRIHEDGGFSPIRASTRAR